MVQTVGFGLFSEKHSYAEMLGNLLDLFLESDSQGPPGKRPENIAPVNSFEKIKFFDFFNAKQS